MCCDITEVCFNNTLLSYHLIQVNQVLKYTGLGIYHSGVQVYGNEWAYGGYPKPVASIYRMKKPCDLSSLSDIDGKFHFKESIEMGTTNCTYEDVRQIVSLCLLYNIGPFINFFFNQSNCS